MAGASSATKQDASGGRLEVGSIGELRARPVRMEDGGAVGVDHQHRHRQRIERLPEDLAGASSSAWPSTGCHGVHAASRSAETSRSPEAVSMTQALASEETAGRQRRLLRYRMAIDAPSGDARSAASVRSSASGPIEKSNSSTSCWRAMAAMVSAFECITVVSTMSRRCAARMPCSRDVRSFVVETKRTLSPAAALSAAGSDQPKLPLSKLASPKPLPAGGRGDQRDRRSGERDRGRLDDRRPGDSGERVDPGGGDAAWACPRAPRPRPAGVPAARDVGAPPASMALPEAAPPGPAPRLPARAPAPRARASRAAGRRGLARRGPVGRGRRRPALASALARSRASTAAASASG